MKERIIEVSKSDLLLFVLQQMKLMTVCVCGGEVFVVGGWGGVSMYVVENWDTMNSNLSR